MHRKLKNWAGLFCACIMASLLLVGCGTANQRQAIDQDATKEATWVGMISNMNASEKQYTDIMRQIEKRTGQVVKPTEIVYYDDFTTLKMGLDSKSVDEISVYDSTAEYMLARNPQLITTDYTKMELADSFCCALSENNLDLLEDINNGLQSMKEDGTLDELAEKYIKGILAGQEPPAVAIKKIEGAGTIKVAVTGDLPPIDLVLADGSPAGFNTAVLAELGQRIGKNIDIVVLNSASRAAALSSQKVDMVFWAIVPEDSIDLRPKDVDKPAGIALTIPYYRDKITHVALKR